MLQKDVDVIDANLAKCAAMGISIMISSGAQQRPPTAQHSTQARRVLWSLEPGHAPCIHICTCAGALFSAT